MSNNQGGHVRRRLLKTRLCFKLNDPTITKRKEENFQRKDGGNMFQIKLFLNNNKRLDMC